MAKDEWQRAHEKRQQSEVTKLEMGNWLQSLVPWDIYATGTWSKRVTLNGVLYGSRRYLEQIEKWAAVPIYSFIGVERGDGGGLLHAHFLVGNVGHLQTYCGARLANDVWGKSCCLLHAWPWGYARVETYDPKLGAAHYVSKYVTKELCEWDLRGFPAVPQLALRNPLWRMQVN